jgi:RNA polymerase sigma factor for flagellar operon FliA
MSSLTTKLKNLKDYRCEMTPEIKDQIVVEYAPLVRFIAQKIAARLPANIELDDLISCGVIGLMDAISKFDPTRDNKFKTYAEFRIRGSILDELRSQDWVPRSVREKSKQLEKAYTKLERDFGRPATDDEMCTELECSLPEFHEMLNRSKSVSLLNIDDSASFNRGDKKLMMGLLEHRRSSNPYAATNYKRAQNVIKDGIKSLPEKQRLVLSLYYFEDLNLKEIGQVLDVTESRVSQLHTQAILKLKAKLKNDFDSHEDIAV